MEWCVVKQGAEMFDALHAYGLGTVLAGALDAPVRLTQEGLVYRLRSRTRTRPHATVDILDRILPVPTLKDLVTWERNSAPMSLPWMTLDGLLAALFTSRGARLLSVADLFRARRASQRRVTLSAAREGLAKARAAIARWKEYARRQSSLPAEWLEGVLQDYDALCPTIPLPAKEQLGVIGVWMTLEPSYGYSARRPLSDGYISDKTNVTLAGARYAPLLAFVGATRFLRAHRVARHQANFYVPLAAAMTLYPQTVLPPLSPTAHTFDHALALRWLAYAPCTESFGIEAQSCARLRQPATVGSRPALALHWNGLAYQVMHTQGVQHAISCRRGCLDYAWLAEVERRTASAMVTYWKWVLGCRLEQAPFEVDNLVDCLIHRRMEDWLAHLRDAALAQSAHRPQTSGLPVCPYHLHEVKEVAAKMVPSTTLPLYAVLEREQGTLRFGHALRLLGRHTPGPLRDLVDDLDAVQTCDQLIRVLAQAAQECAVAMAKSPFIIVPSDDDLKYLLDDVDRYGARTIAGLLIILSALRYRRLPDEPSEPSPPPRSAPLKPRRKTK
jgi:hypothetical protein